MILNTVLDEIQSVIKQMSDKDLEKITEHFNKNIRIFVDGEGRSGFMAKAFAMRLMHIGYNVYVIGETITPSINEGDLLISISGSGETKSILERAKKAKETGCTIVGVTSKMESSLGIASDDLLIVPGVTKYDSGEARKSVQLLSSLSDQCVHIVLDCLCLMLSRRDKITESQALNRHSNME